MRILALCDETYPIKSSTAYVLMHQSMALEELGHEVHLFSISKSPMPLADYLNAYDFEMVFVNVEFLHDKVLVHSLEQCKGRKPLRVVGSLYSLPGPAEPAWELVDFTVTPWKGRTVEEIARIRDIRYLPLAYNARLHRRSMENQQLGAVFVGNSSGDEALAWLKQLRDERLLLCIGAGFEQEYLDPFMLGQVYAAAHCLPNFHHESANDENRMLNERFWQTARCSTPVNDYSPLMDEVWSKLLLQEFCFRSQRDWLDRVRALSSGAVRVDPALLLALDHSLAGHSYTDRMKQLLEWLR